MEEANERKWEKYEELPAEAGESSAGLWRSGTEALKGSHCAEHT